MIKKILITEDEKQLQMILKKRLEKESWQVFQAFNGKECLEIVNKEKIDLILLDIVMPVMNGMEVLAYLRKDKKYAKIKIIVLSNSTAKNLFGDYENVEYMIKSNHKLDDIIKKIKELT